MEITVSNYRVLWWPERRRLENPIAGGVYVGVLGAEYTHYCQFDSSSGGNCFFDRREMPKITQIMMMFIEFHTLVVRDGIDPQAAHKEFLKVKEYRERISPDIPGAVDEDA